MGQVHPRGPNVVRLSQRGAGHNCECGAPYFDEHEIASDVRLRQLFPGQEIIQTVQAANVAMKKATPHKKSRFNNNASSLSIYVHTLFY